MIEVTVKREADLALFEGRGPLTIDEVTAAIELYYAGPPTRFVLWDLRDAELSSLASEDVRRVAQLTVELGRGRRDGRTALVASADLAFGLSRVFQNVTQAHDHASQLRVFRTLDEARAWLDSFGD